MSDFRFESKMILAWLWIIPVLWVFVIMVSSRTQKKLIKKFSAKLTPFLTDSLSMTRRKWKTYLQLTAVFFMIMALARPQTSDGKQQVKNEGIELLLMVDVSNSMMAEDIRPSRLSLARSELSRLVDMSPGHRIGLVAFAGSAVTLSPMTTDHDAIKMYLDSVDTSVVSTQGTNFAKALAEANSDFDRGGLGEQEGSQVTRAIIIASDGEDQEPGAETEIQKLVEKGIFIFTIGFGTEQGGAIPMRDDNGLLRGYKKDDKGQAIISKTKGTVLKDIASRGKGSFHHATFQGDAVAAISRDISELKRSQFESGEVKSYGEEFQIFAFLAFFIAAIEFLLGERKPIGRIWRGRFEVAID